MTQSSAIFETRYEADHALTRLEAIGVREDQISVLATDQARARHFIIQNNTKANEGATAGATLGGLAGAVAAGIMSAGAVAIPGLNIVVSGYLISALAGLGAGAATGGILGSLIGLGFPEHEAKIFEKGLQGGNILLVVKSKDSKQKHLVDEILSDAQKGESRAGRSDRPGSEMRT